jgi:hypothetical protein
VDEQTTDGKVKTALYAVYASSHHGFTGNAQAQAPFERDFRPFLPRSLDSQLLDIGCAQGGLVS